MKSNTLSNICQGVRNTMALSDKKFSASANMGYEKTIGFVYSSIGASNYIASTYMVDVIDYIDDLGKLKFNVKKMANNACKVYDEYKRIAVAKLNEDTKERSTEGNRRALWDNMNIQIYMRVEDDIMALEKAVKDFLDKDGESDKNVLFSKLYTARILIELATQRCEKIFGIIAKDFTSGYDLRRNYPEFQLDDMVLWWVKLTNILTGTTDVPNVTNDDPCQEAFNNLDLKLSNTELINESALTALKFDSCFDDAVKIFEKEKAKKQKEDGNNSES